MGHNVKMILNAIDPIQMAFFVFQDTPNVFEQFGAVFFDKRGPPVLGAIYNLIQNLCVRTHFQYWFER